MFYIKTKNGKFKPIKFEEISIKEWENKLVIAKIGDELNPIKEEEMEEIAREMDNLEILETIENFAIVISSYNINFDIIDPKNIGEKYVAIQITNPNDISSNLDSIQKTLRELTSRKDPPN